MSEAKAISDTPPASSHRSRRRRRSSSRSRRHRTHFSLTRWFDRLPIDGERALAALLVLIVTGSVLSIGAVHPPVILTVGALAAAAWLVAATLWLRTGRALPLLWPAVVLVALAGVTALQLIPLPLSWLHAIAPSNWDVWARVTMPLAQPPPAYAPISLDPGATSVELVRWLTYAAVFAAAAIMAYRRGARWGLGLVFISALLAAITTVGHGLLGAKEVFGIYQPSFTPQPWHVGPLLNPNNLSGYLNLGVLCGMGLLLSDRVAFPQWALAIAIAFLLAVDVTSGSRAGLLVLPFALFALAGSIDRMRRRQARSTASVRQARILMVATIVFGVALAILAGSQRLWRELIDDNLNKLRMFDWLKTMLAEFCWFGTGRGAFESVSPAFQPGRGSLVYTHAENFVAQWCIEWGIPVAVAALVALAWFFRPSKLGVRRSSLAAAGWIGIVAVAAQNMVDLGFEIPAIPIAVLVVAATLWGSRARLTQPAAKARLKRRQRWALTGATAGVLAAAWIGAALYGMTDLGTERQRLQRQILAATAPRSAPQRTALQRAIRRAMLRHPADPYFPLLGGTLAWQERDGNPLPWLQRALERSLVNGKTHLLLAQVLMAKPVRHQALLELRLAAQSDPSLVKPAAELAVKWAESLAELLTAAPQQPQRAASLDAMAKATEDRNIGAVCDELALELEPESPGPHRRLAEDLLVRWQTGAGCPAEQDCDAQFARHVAALQTSQPWLSTATALRARRLAFDGQPRAAEKLLAESCPQFDDYEICLRQRLRIAAELPELTTLNQAAKALLSAVCVEPKPCAKTATWVGDLHAMRGEWGAALSQYDRAVRDGENLARLLKLAGAASQAGMHAKAVRTLQRAKALDHGANREIDTRLAHERELLVTPLLGR